MSISIWQNHENFILIYGSIQIFIIYFFFYIRTVHLDIIEVLFIHQLMH